MQALTGAGHHQLPVFDSLKAQDGVGNGLDGAAPALHNHYFQAIVMIEVHVSCGEYLATCIVLNLD